MRSREAEKGCDKKAVKKEWIENLVVEQTMGVVMNGPLMEQITGRLLAMQGQESFDLRLLRKQLGEAEKGIENMLNAIQMGILTSSTKERLEALEDQRNAVSAVIFQSFCHNVLAVKQDFALGWCINPPRRDSSVVLPDPDGPSTAYNFPASSAMLMFDRTGFPFS